MSQPGVPINEVIEPGDSDGSSTEVQEDAYETQDIVIVGPIHLMWINTNYITFKQSLKILVSITGDIKKLPLIDVDVN